MPPHLRGRRGCCQSCWPVTVAWYCSAIAESDPQIRISTLGYSNGHIVFRTLLAETPMKADFSVVKIADIPRG